MGTDSVPIHDSLLVTGQSDIYQNSEWWKSVVRYRHQDASNEEVAVYLWHNDGDGWDRKNKYVIKTAEGWLEDKQVVESMLQSDLSGDKTDAFPVSDYYHVCGGVTVFQSDGWWKAILNIDQKGSYDTDEIMIYLWQQRDGDWRRRQKYTIKDQESWEEETELIEQVLEEEAESQDSSTPSSTRGDTEDTSSPEMTEEFDDLAAELDDHLSEALD